MSSPESYRLSLETEKNVYGNLTDIHHLPPIFHYWSQRYLLPKLQACGFTSPTQMFADQLESVCAAGADEARFVSLGAGNCDLELELAAGLKAKGHRFVIDCLEVNPAMLERGRNAAAAQDLAEHLHFIEADLNHWKASGPYDAAIASQSLHHVVNLEGLFDQLKQSLRPGAKFLISDMIGRNGHQRWPEALQIVREFWRKLPPSYRFNRVLGYYEERYQDWDCSLEGFEGVRAQDILPLLQERFHFQFFLGYGNVIDPFIDRAFGHHFDPQSEWDRAFIDEVQRRDEEELSAGRLTPTHMLAVVTNEPGTKAEVPEHAGIVDASTIPPYDWSWPHDHKSQLELVTRHLAQTGREIRGRTQWALSLNNELEARTAWALSLEKDVRDQMAWARGIEKDLEERTAWSRKLEADLAARTALSVQLQEKIDTLEAEIETRTNWALRMNSELTKLQNERSKPRSLRTRLRTLLGGA